MLSSLFIPWFRASAFHIPLPFTDQTIPLQPFGLLVAAGVLLGAKLAEWWASRRGLDQRDIGDLISHSVTAGFLGAFSLNLLAYNFDALVAFAQNPSKDTLLAMYGISSYGGFIGGLLGGLLWAYRRKKSLMVTGEALTFAFPLAWFFGRMGCFVVHDHPGLVTDFPLAVADYQVGNPPFLPRHDLGLYEVLWSAACLAIFFVLDRKPRPPGFYSGLILVLYAPVRFFLDYLRIEGVAHADTRWLGLTPAQYASVFFLVFGASLLVAGRRRAPTLEAALHPSTET